MDNIDFFFVHDNRSLLCVMLRTVTEVLRAITVLATQEQETVGHPQGSGEGWQDMIGVGS